MRAVIQRVKWAKVVVDGVVQGEIGPGLMTLLGVAKGDTIAEVEWMISKILRLRIFEDEQGKMNKSLVEVAGGHLIVSQFTLYGDASKGNRPSFMNAAPPLEAQALYEKALELSQAGGIVTAGGKFQAHMEVSLLNDGPVTLVLDSG